MAGNRTKKSVINTFTGFLLKIVTLFAPFIVRTVIIKQLGLEYLGLNSLFSSILQVLSLAELGFSSAVAFAMYKPIEERDTPLICALLKLLRKIYLVVGTVITVTGLALMPALKFLIEGDVPADINLYVLYLIYLANTSISYFLWAHKSVLFIANQRADVENLIQMVCFVAMYACQIVVLFLIPNYYIYIIFMPLSSLAINVIRFILSKKKYPNYKEQGEISKEEKKDIANKIKALFGHRLSYIVVASTDSIIISAFLGLAPLAIYQNYYFIINALVGFVNIFHSSITASVGNSIVFESKEKNYSDFKKLTFVNVWLVGWMSITFFVLCQHFIKIWVGEENMMSIWLVLLLSSYLYLWKFKDILNVYKDAAALWKIDFWKPYVVAAVNLALDLLLFKYIGVLGVVVATIVSAFFVSFPWETRTFYKAYFKEKEGPYYLRMFIYTIIVYGVGALTWFVCELLPSESVLYLFVKFAICLALPNVVFFLLSFKTTEANWLFGKTKSLFKRNK